MENKSNKTVQKTKYCVTPLYIYKIINVRNTKSLGSLSIFSSNGIQEQEVPHPVSPDTDFFDLWEHMVEEGRDVVTDINDSLVKMGINYHELDYKLIQEIYLPTSDKRSGNFDLYGMFKITEYGYVWSIDLYEF